MDAHHRYQSHHRQSLRPGTGSSTLSSSMLASRYGLSIGNTAGTKRASVSCGSSPIRSRSNSTSRFKAAAAVAVAAATGNKHSFNTNRKSIVPGSLSFTSVRSSTPTSSGISSIVSSSLNNSLSSGASNSSASSSSTTSNNSSMSTTSNANSNAHSIASSSTAAGISSTVVSFMKKFVNKAAPINQNSGDSIDQSFEQYQKSLQQQKQQQQQNANNVTSSNNANITTQNSQNAQSPTKYFFSTITGASNIGINSSNKSSSSASYGQANNDSNITSSLQISPTSAYQTLSTTTTTTTMTISPLVPNSSSTLTTTSPTGSIASASTASTMIGAIGYQSANNNDQRPSTASGLSNTANASSSSSSPISGPLFSKIRAKVASTFQQQQQSNVQQNTIPVSDNSNSSNQEMMDTRNRNSGANSSVQPATAGTPVSSAGYQRAPMLAMIHSSQSSSLTNEQLTAHLTEEERQILQKVWQKEEEFKEIALKNFAKNMSGTDIIVETPTGTGKTLSTLQPVSTGLVAPGDVSHLSTNLLDPVAAAVHRRRSSAILSADADGFCRICRKVIMKNETSHRCSNCQELVCDDCSSYSSREESKYWMCSFCRRRGSHLILVTTAGQTSSTSTVSSSETGSSPLKRQKSSSHVTTKTSATTATSSIVNGTTTTTSGQKFLTATSNALNAKRKLSWQETQRPNSAIDQFGQQTQNRQSSLDLNHRSSSSLIKTNQQTNSNSLKTSQNNLMEPNTTRSTRVYSLSDDEELWNDEDDDDANDEDEEDIDDDVILKNDEENKENIANYNNNNNVENVDTILSPNNSINNNNVHYGTLQTMPAEQLMLKHQQQGTLMANTKKLKKKMRHHQALVHNHNKIQYNSDDEMIFNMAHNINNENELYTSTPPITITSLDEPQSTTTTIVHQQNPSFGMVTATGPSSTPLNNISQNGVSYQQCQTKQAKTTAPMVMPKIITVSGNGSGTKGMSSVPVAHWWRLTNKARNLSRGQLIGATTSIGTQENFYTTPGIRKQLSSESSDYSDGFNPPQDSLTPSSDYSRSPRESADSDMLCLPGYSIGCRTGGIPSVMIGDDVMGINSIGQSGSYLSTKDCYLRRGSAGRALPKIPAVAGGSSMLDLPQSRKGSQHSLDIPSDQPRRASAPESGADPIRIVINECGDLSSSHVQLSDSTKTPTNKMSTENLNQTVTDTGVIMAGKVTPHPGPSIIQVPTTATLQQRMRYQLSRAASITTHYERAILQRDKSDQSIRTGGFSLAITGGKLCELDGMLYAYITWIKPGGQADRQSLKSSDKILEWNGKSLVNCSHEQVAHIIATSGDHVEIIVESMTRDQPAKQRRHSMVNSKQPAQTSEESKTLTNKNSIPSSVIQKASARPSSAAAVISTGSLDAISSSTIASSNNVSTATIPSTFSQQPGSQSLRRRLPQIPVTALANAHQSTTTSNATNSSALLTDAQIYLQVTIDANIRQLSVMIIQAKGLERHPIYSQNLGLEAYAQLRLLPEMGFKICQTELSRSFDWNETLIYHQFPLERIEKITLDLSIWCTNPATYIPGAGGGLGAKPPRTAISDNSSFQIDHQLASTRIPLRSALLMQVSEWWPLIPSNTEIKIPPSIPATSAIATTSNIVQPSPISLLNQQSLMNSGLTTTASNSSIAPALFFQKAPSMDHLGSRSGSGQNGQLLSDQMLSAAMMMMTSRSTPGSRRNSNRSDQGDFSMFPNHSPFMGSRSARTSPRMKISPTPPPVSNWFTRYRSSPTSRASSTVSSVASSIGRHSLDESYTSNSGGNVAIGRGNSIGPFTGSLRLAQNRHSIGNLYPGHPGGVNTNVIECVNGPIDGRMQTNNTQNLSTNDQQSLVMRRKSSSAIVHVDQGQKNQLSVPGGDGNGAVVGVYSQLTNTDSYQFLLERNNNNDNNKNANTLNANDDSIDVDQSDQESDIDDDDTSDDDEDFDNLLKDSSYTIDSLDNRDRNSPQKSQGKILINNEPETSNTQNIATTNTVNVPNTLALPKVVGGAGNNSNLLSIDSIHGFSVGTSAASTAPPTPLHDDDDDNSNNGGGLTIPGCQERRPSFLRRLVPSAAETVMQMVMGGPGSNAQPSDEILHTSSSTMVSNVHNEPRRIIKVVGEIKLGFIMTKGFLEIEICAARGLPDSSFGPYPPETYVKTYLIDRGRQLYKRKTHVVKGKDPQYRQTLKYDASIIYGRTLLVSVWEKQRRRHTFDANTPIGSVEINVNQLQLHKLTIRWFKLRTIQHQQQQQQNHSEESSTARNSLDQQTSLGVDSTASDLSTGTKILIETPAAATKI